MSRCDWKVVLLGSEAVGKTSLVLRYVNGTFSNAECYQNTIGAAFCPKRVECGDRTYYVGIWDTAGSERYESMTRLYYRGAHAAVLCYDATQAESWTRLKHWLQELRNVQEECRVYLCATKADLVAAGAARAVDADTAAAYARDLAGHFETSSKDGRNVDALFQTIVEDLARETRRDGASADPAPRVALHKERRHWCTC